MALEAAFVYLINLFKYQSFEFLDASSVAF